MSAAESLLEDLLADAASLRRLADQMHPSWHAGTAAALRTLADETEARARKLVLK